MPETIWKGIADDLRERILSGEWAPGERIPPVRQLMAEYKARSSLTVGRATLSLITEGLLKSDPDRPGLGTWVAERPPLISSSRDRIAVARRTGHMTGPGESSRIVSAELVAAPEHVARALGLPPGSEVVARRRVSLMDGRPVQRSVSYLPGELAALAPDLLSADRIPGGTVGALARTGRHVVRGVEQFAVPWQGHPPRSATEDEAADLEIEPGTPILAGRNTWYDEHGAALEYGESATVPGRWQTLEWVMPPARG